MEAIEFPDVPRSLDSIFNNAIQGLLTMKQIQHQQMEMEKVRNAERLQSAVLGFSTSDLTPRNIQTAQRGLPAGYQGPPQPGDTSFQGLSPVQQAIRSYIDRKRASDVLGVRKEEAEVKRTEAEAGRASAFANLLQSGEGGYKIVTDPSTGIQLLSQPSPTGQRVTPIPGQQLSPEAAKNVANADSGLRNLSTIRSILTSPEGRKSIAKAGGSGATLLSIGDTTAQNLRTALSEASDVLARLRTGAQINDYELRYYTSLLSNRWRTLEGNLNALDTIEKFYIQLRSDLLSGKRIPGLAETSQPIIFTPSEGGKSGGAISSDLAQRARQILEERKNAGTRKTQ